ncbi:spike protein [Beluga whale coronavirus SW1]|uniref:Spike protein n=1 Tax=Beluga whale coronavirus (strain SW1) TaxID=694015 RepID=B2BW33_BWCOV|nr:spike protein [Beluga whale coronavirus SW1]ABW87820.1 spike protein [Beluga whale coronavirus SW1]
MVRLSFVIVFLCTMLMNPLLISAIDEGLWPAGMWYSHLLQENNTYTVAAFQEHAILPSYVNNNWTVITNFTAENATQLEWDDPYYNSTLFSYVNITMVGDNCIGNFTNRTLGELGDIDYFPFNCTNVTNEFRTNYGYFIQNVMVARCLSSLCAVIIPKGRVFFEKNEMWWWSWQDRYQPGNYTFRHERFMSLSQNITVIGLAGNFSLFGLGQTININSASYDWGTVIRGRLDDRICELQMTGADLCNLTRVDTSSDAFYTAGLVRPASAALIADGAYKPIFTGVFHDNETHQVLYENATIKPSVRSFQVKNNDFDALYVGRKEKFSIDAVTIIFRLKETSTYLDLPFCNETRVDKSDKAIIGYLIGGDFYSVDVSSIVIERYNPPQPNATSIPTTISTVSTTTSGWEDLRSLNMSCVRFDYKLKKVMSVPLPMVKAFIIDFKQRQLAIDGFPVGALIADFEFRFSIVAMPQTFISTLNYTTALVTFDKGNVRSVIDCNSEKPFDRLRCDLQTDVVSDGFYPVNIKTNEAKENTTFIDVPATLANLTLEVFVSSPEQSPACVIKSYKCVDTRYFYISDYSYSCAENGIPNDAAGAAYCRGVLDQINNYGVRGMDFKGKCPFAGSKVNSGLTFDKICFGVYEQGCQSDKACRFGFYFDNVQFSQYGNKLYYKPQDLGFIDYQFGTLFKNSLVQSNIIQEGCHDYDIYGYKGTGVVKPFSDYSYLQTGGLIMLDSGGFPSLFRYNFALYEVTQCTREVAQLAVASNNAIGYYLPKQVTIDGVNASTSCNTTGAFKYCYYDDVIHVGRDVSNVTINVCNPSLMMENSHCINIQGNFMVNEPAITFNSTQYQPLLGVSGDVQLPRTLMLHTTTEFIQTHSPKIVIDCTKYVCGSSERCRRILVKYGGFCESIMRLLNGVNMADDVSVTDFLDNFNSFDNISVSLQNLNASFGQFEGYGFQKFLPKSFDFDGSDPRDARSTIEDILFDKVTTVGLGTVDADYDKCTKGLSVADLVCAQYYNGIMVLPGVADAEKMAMYTGALVGGMVLGGITSAAAIPFATQIQARVNYLALTQNAIQENQKIIVQQFNKAIDSMTSAFQSVNEGFSAVSSAITEVQNAVNAQSQALTKLLGQLNYNFGATTSSIKELYERLAKLEADVQVDRLINGRLTALSAFVAARQVEAAKVASQRVLAAEKINECVKSTSNRYGFCGNGAHIISFPQNAPNGMLFVHFSLVPNETITVKGIIGLCLNNSIGIVPAKDRGMFIQCSNGTYCPEFENSFNESKNGNVTFPFAITSREQYNPRQITTGDIQMLTSCNSGYTHIEWSQLPLVAPPYDDFDKEFDKLYEKWNYTLEELEKLNVTFPYLNVSEQIDIINSAMENIKSQIQNLNSSYIDLEWLNKYERYSKWPWWVWLIIVLCFAAFCLLVFWIFICTGCCGGCCNCCGIPALFGYCKRKAHYERLRMDEEGNLEEIKAD